MGLECLSALVWAVKEFAMMKLIVPGIVFALAACSASASPTRCIEFAQWDGTNNYVLTPISTVDLDVGRPIRSLRLNLVVSTQSPTNLPNDFMASIRTSVLYNNTSTLAVIKVPRNLMVQNPAYPTRWSASLIQHLPVGNTATFTSSPIEARTTCSIPLKVDPVSTVQIVFNDNPTCPADLASPNAATPFQWGTPDGQQDAADLNFFMQNYNDRTLRADLAGPNGSGPDGQVTIDDFNYFMNSVFSPC